MKLVRHSVTIGFLTVLLTTVLVTGCTPTPSGPSTTTPTVSTTTPSPSAAASPSASPTPDREAAIKQAETAYRTLNRDLNELLKKGGATSTPPDIAAKISGPYQKNTDLTVTYYHKEQLILTGDTTIETFTLSPKSKTWPTTELIFDMCTDASRSNILKGPNRNFVQSGKIARYEVTMRYIDSTWKVWDVPLGTDVTSC